MQSLAAMSSPVEEVEVEVAEVVPEPGMAQPLQTSHPYVSAAKAYRNEQLLNLSPVQVIDKLSSVAIQACKKSDAALAQRAVNELIIGLNFEYQEISIGLYRLYEYCKHCIRKEKMNDAVVVLEELRSTWAQAFKL